MKVSHHDSLEKLLSNTATNENGCMEWLGATNSGGYAIVNKRIVTRIVLSRLGYDMSNPKVYACHTCDNEKCINPDHLFLGTSSDNQKDYWSKVKAGNILREAGGRMRNTIFGPRNLEKNDSSF